MKLNKLIKTGTIIATIAITAVGCGKSEKDIVKECTSNQLALRRAVATALANNPAIEQSTISSIDEVKIYLKSEEQTKCPLDGKTTIIEGGKVVCPNHGVLRSKFEADDLKNF